MGARLVSAQRPHNVIPFPSRGLPPPGATAEAPEPAQLYQLTVLVFVLHIPAVEGQCETCGQHWPCEQVRLAFRLREGF